MSTLKNSTAGGALPPHCGVRAAAAGVLPRARHQAPHPRRGQGAAPQEGRRPGLGEDRWGGRLLLLLQSEYTLLTKSELLSFNFRKFYLEPARNVEMGSRH